MVVDGLYFFMYVPHHLQDTPKAIRQLQEKDDIEKLRLDYEHKRQMEAIAVSFFLHIALPKI